MLVHPDGAALNPRRGGRRALFVRAPDRTAQSIVAGVGARDDIVQIAIFEHGEDGAELFLAHDRRIVVDVAHDGRRQEIAGPVDDVAAGDQLPFLGAALEQRLELVELGAILDRADLRTLARAVVDDRRARQLGQFVAENLVHGFGHIGALDRDADLAGIGHRALENAPGGVDRVGIVQDDRRVIAAQLQRHALERRGGGLHHLLPRFGRSGEGNLRDVGMAGHCRAEIIVVAQDVDDPGRQYVGAQGAEQQAGERGGRRRLRHHRIARHQRRAQLVHQQHQREIPRRDRADYAQRLAQFDDLALVIVLEQHGLQAHRRKGAQGEGRAHHFHAGLVERLALFAGQQLAEFAGARLQGVGQRGDQGGAFLDRTS